MGILDWIASLEAQEPDHEFERWLEKGKDEEVDEASLLMLEQKLQDLLDSGLTEWDPDTSPRYSMEWLKEVVTAIGSEARTEELVGCLIGLLRSTSENRQYELVDLLGFDHIELASEMLEHASEIVEAYEMDKINQLAATRHCQAPGQSITVKTSSMKSEMKEAERLAKKKGILLSGLSTQKHITAAAGSILSDEELRKLISTDSKQPDYPGIFKAGATTSAISSYMSSIAVPEGTVREDTVSFEEFTLPYNTIKPCRKAHSIKMIPVDQLDPLSRKAFPPPYKSLNRMQSAVFHVAHQTNENMLVCAPTGAGKTDVAMLTVLRCILDHTDANGTIRKGAFKIIYVAPMKALAAEVTQKFGKRLGKLGLTVREYTGDMQLTRAEVQSAQMIVTTPEKWDVITRKSQGDVDLVDAVRLLIIDEVHLLQDDRGPVIEAIVARTLRSVEMSQKPVRIVGLSATLPNFIDVALFLRVNLYVGLFYFDETFRPCPLTQSLVGIKGAGDKQIKGRLEQYCFDRCVGFLQHGHQVMIFVHSRNETVNTAKKLIELAREEGCQALFQPPDKESPGYKRVEHEITQKSRNRELLDLFRNGLAVHHAGMARSDRSLVESLFEAGHIRALVCTATLAWGVNLPAHAVIIKGTDVWDSQKGGFCRLGVLDVLQIFGRAGRPQYESYGEAVLVTRHADLYHYLRALMSQSPIESQITTGSHLIDMLNAEVALGTVGSVDEALRWLRYTYLSIRMARNPTAYGLTPKDVSRDPLLEEHTRKLVSAAAAILKGAGMISFETATGRLGCKDLGRIASHFYIGHQTVELFGKTLAGLAVSEETVLCMASQAREFHQLRVRPEDLEELLNIEDVSAHLAMKGVDKTGSSGKAALLIQAWISRHPLDNFALISDLNYVGQNAGRILRAAWEMAKSQGWARAARACLSLAVSFERQVWMTAHPLCQLLLPLAADSRKMKKPLVSMDVLEALQSSSLSVETIRSGKPKTLAGRLNLKWSTLVEKDMERVQRGAGILPLVKVAHSSVYPISAAGFQIELALTADFSWDQTYHGAGQEVFQVWLEAADGEHFVSKETCQEIIFTKEQVTCGLKFFLPSLPPRIYARVLSDSWLLQQMTFEVPVKGVVREPAEKGSEPEDCILSDAATAVLTGLGVEPASLNPIQRQILSQLDFDRSCLITAPAGSGMDLIEQAVLLRHPNATILNGNRPAKGPVIVKQINLMDASLESLLTKKQTNALRFIFGDPIGNAREVASWLGIDQVFSWSPSARVLPLQAQIQGYPGRHHSSRQASMNKPVYQALIKAGCPSTIIWCPSRKQAVLTAQTLIALTLNDDAPDRFVGGEVSTSASVGEGVVRHCLNFGIGLYHPDVPVKGYIREAFAEGRIKVLMATYESLLDLEAHRTAAQLVIIKGTDIIGTTSPTELPPQLVHLALTHFSQPSPDASVLLMTRDTHKTFYKHLLCEAPYLESALSDPEVLAQLVYESGMANFSAEELVAWLKKSSLLFKRLVSNPFAYNCTPGSVGVDEYLWQLSEAALKLVSGLPYIVGLSWKTVDYLAKYVDPQQEISAQLWIRIVSLACSIELRVAESLIPISKSTKESEDLRDFCLHSKALQPVLRWLNGDQGKLVEDFEQPATKILVHLLATIAGVKVRGPGVDYDPILSVLFEHLTCRLSNGNSWSLVNLELLERSLQNKKLMAITATAKFKIVRTGSSLRISSSEPKVFSTSKKSFAAPGVFRAIFSIDGRVTLVVDQLPLDQSVEVTADTVYLADNRGVYQLTV